MTSTVYESPSPLAILLSRQAEQRFGAQIRDVLQKRSHRIIHLEDEPDADGRYPIDIAFLTRDVTGDSGRTVLAPSLLRFYEIVRASPGIQWLQIHSAGADRPFFQELRARHVRLTTGSGANASSVAQMAFTGLLMLARRFPELLDAQRRKAWEPLLGSRAPRPLRGQTALIVGLGPIGLEIARLTRMLGIRTIGVRRSRQACDLVDETVDFSDFASILPRADWIILACPLTDQTRGLLDEAAFRRMPEGASIVNVARGEVMVEQDFVRAIRSGRLAGAYLDVMAEEPLGPDSEIWDLRNVIITPHTAGHTDDHYDEVGRIFLDNLSRWCAGAALRNRVA